MSVAMWVVGARGHMLKVHLTGKVFETVTAELWPVVTDNLFWYSIPAKVAFSFKVT